MEHLYHSFVSSGYCPKGEFDVVVTKDNTYLVVEYTDNEGSFGVILECKEEWLADTNLMFLNRTSSVDECCPVCGADIIAEDIGDFCPSDCEDDCDSCSLADDFAEHCGL